MITDERTSSSRSVPAAESVTKTHKLDKPGTYPLEILPSLPSSSSVHEIATPLESRKTGHPHSTTWSLGQETGELERSLLPRTRKMELRKARPSRRDIAKALTLKRPTRQVGLWERRHRAETIRGTYVQKSPLRIRTEPRRTSHLGSTRGRRHSAQLNNQLGAQVEGRTYETGGKNVEQGSRQTRVAVLEKHVAKESKPAEEPKRPICQTVPVHFGTQTEIRTTEESKNIEQRSRHSRAAEEKKGANKGLLPGHIVGPPGSSTAPRIDGISRGEATEWIQSQLSPGKKV